MHAESQSHISTFYVQREGEVIVFVKQEQFTEIASLSP